MANSITINVYDIGVTEPRTLSIADTGIANFYCALGYNTDSKLYLSYGTAEDPSAPIPEGSLEIENSTAFKGLAVASYDSAIKYSAPTSILVPTILTDDVKSASSEEGAILNLYVVDNTTTLVTAKQNGAQEGYKSLSKRISKTALTTLGAYKITEKPTAYSMLPDYFVGTVDSTSIATLLAGNIWNSGYSASGVTIKGFNTTYDDVPVVPSTEGSIVIGEDEIKYKAISYAAAATEDTFVVYIIDDTTALASIYTDRAKSETTAKFKRFSVGSIYLYSTTTTVCLGVPTSEESVYDYIALYSTPTTFVGLALSYDAAVTYTTSTMPTEIVLSEDTSFYDIDNTTTLVTAYSDASTQITGATKRFVTENDVKIYRFNNYTTTLGPLTGEFLVDAAATEFTTNTSYIALHGSTLDSNFKGITGDYNTAITCAAPDTPEDEESSISETTFALSGTTASVYYIDNTTTLVVVKQNGAQEGKSILKKRIVCNTVFATLGAYHVESTQPTEYEAYLPEYFIGTIDTTVTTITGLTGGMIWSDKNSATGVTIKGFNTTYDDAPVVPSTEGSATITLESLGEITLYYKAISYSAEAYGNDEFTIHAIDDTTSLVSVYTDRAKTTSTAKYKRFVNGALYLVDTGVDDNGIRIQQTEEGEEYIKLASSRSSFIGLATSYDAAVTYAKPESSGWASKKTLAETLSTDTEYYDIDNTTTFVTFSSSKTGAATHRAAKHASNLAMKLNSSGLVNIADANDSSFTFSCSITTAQAFTGVTVDESTEITAPTEVGTDVPIPLDGESITATTTITCNYATTGYTVKIYKNVSDEDPTYTLSGITYMVINKDSITTDNATASVTGLDAVHFYGLALKSAHTTMPEKPDNGLFRYQTYTVSADTNMLLINATEQVYDIQFKVADSNTGYTITEVTKSPSADLDNSFFSGKVIGKDATLGKFCSRGGSILQDFSFKLTKN